MKKLLLVLAAVAVLALPAAASAHPLGNFTVNRYSGIDLAGDQIYVHYVLDLAEIPTFQLAERVRREGFGTEIARGLVLQVDGRRLDLRTLDRKVSSRPGAGGLETLRFEAVYEADGAGSTVAFRDRNFPSRIGWREVVVTARDGARIVSSSAPSASPSDALRAYPDNLLQSPLDVSSAGVTYEPGTAAGPPPSLTGAAAPERESGGFESLISEEDLSLGVILISLAVAMFWGAAHALSPGHGKAIVAAYLVGTRGTARHAVLLGGIVTVTHTIGVFALGLVTLALSEFIVPEDLYPWLNLVAAVLVVGVGLTVLRLRVRDWGRAGRPSAHAHDHHHGDHDHDHDHDHGHGHEHDHGHGHHHHVPEPGGGLRGLIAVGISGGLLPCPTALVVLLAAISLHRVGYGLLLIVAFSLGLAAAITAIGLLAVTAKRLFGRVNFNGPLIRALPAVSALVILGLGIAMTVRSIPSVI